MYRDAWDPDNHRPTCLVALVNDPLDPRLWNTEIRTVDKTVAMYTIRPIAMDGEIYAAYGTKYFMDLGFPLALRLRARECYDPRHLDKRWDKFCIVPPRLPVEHLEDHCVTALV